MFSAGTIYFCTADETTTDLRVSLSVCPWSGLALVVCLGLFGLGSYLSCCCADTGWPTPTPPGLAA